MCWPAHGIESAVSNSVATKAAITTGVLLAKDMAPIGQVSASVVRSLSFSLAQRKNDARFVFEPIIPT